MKIATFPRRVRYLVPSLFVWGLSCGEELSAVQVDSELVILVDVSSSVSNSELSDVLESLATSFESASVIDSISSGAIGSIAASLVFWSNNNRQEVGVSWLEISDTTSAVQFADSVRNASRPFRGASAIGSALLFGSETFGDETGGSANGFESIRQLVSLWGDGEDNNTSGSGPRVQRLQAARDAAIAAGVDEISAVLLNNGNANLQDYYESNVIGSDGLSSPVVTSVDIANISQAAINEVLSGTISRGAAVPEPSSIGLTGLAGLCLLGRRRR